jgi:hypothetical protein
MSLPKSTPEATTPSRKRSAEALFYDTEEKKESPTALEQPCDTSAIPVRSIAASMQQASQESATMTVSSGQAAMALAKTEQQDMVMAQKNLKSISKKSNDEVDQEIPEDLERWFQAFAEAVDDEEVLSLGDLSKAIPRLVQEGKKRDYLTKAIKLPINELGWEPDCTPLHYAAAKGNSQAVEVLLREPEVMIDAQTEESGTTPLQFAAFEGRLETVRLLINAYKDRGKIKEIDTRDDERTSTLQYAALGIQEAMNREVAELLVKEGADPYQMDGDISLMDMAAVAGNSAMIEYCLEKVYNRENEASIIWSAINLAKSKSHMNIVVILQSRYEAL